MSGMSERSAFSQITGTRSGYLARIRSASDLRFSATRTRAPWQCVRESDTSRGKAAARWYKDWHRRSPKVAEGRRKQTGPGWQEEGKDTIRRHGILIVRDSRKDGSFAASSVIIESRVPHRTRPSRQTCIRLPPPSSINASPSQGRLFDPFDSITSSKDLPKGCSVLKDCLLMVMLLKEGCNVSSVGSRRDRIRLVKLLCETLETRCGRPLEIRTRPGNNEKGSGLNC
jgi:hypothetical protein